MDIVERLCYTAGINEQRFTNRHPFVSELREAAAEITSLREENERLKREKGTADAALQLGGLGVNMQQVYIQTAKDMAKMADDNLKRAEAAESSLREALEVIRPFSSLPNNANGKSRYFIQLLVCPEGGDPVGGVKDYGRLIRAAAAFIDKHNPPVD